MTYRPHGHQPSDAEIAAAGYKAFGPARPPFVPTADDFERAHQDLATGDPEELAGLAGEVAAWWPRGCWPYPFWGYGYGYNWVDDE